MSCWSIIWNCSNSRMRPTKGLTPRCLRVNHYLVFVQLLYVCEIYFIAIVEWSEGAYIPKPRRFLNLVEHSEWSRKYKIPNSKDCRKLFIGARRYCLRFNRYCFNIIAPHAPRALESLALPTNLSIGPGAKSMQLLYFDTCGMGLIVKQVRWITY